MSTSCFHPFGHWYSFTTIGQNWLDLNEIKEKWSVCLAALLTVNWGATALLGGILMLDLSKHYTHTHTRLAWHYGAATIQLLLLHTCTRVHKNAKENIRVWNSNFLFSFTPKIESKKNGWKGGMKKKKKGIEECVFPASFFLPISRGPVSEHSRWYVYTHLFAWR